MHLVQPSDHVVPLLNGLLPGPEERSLPVMLVRARDAFISHFKPLLIANGISEPQWRVLRVLRDVDRLEPHEVAFRAGVLSPSLTRMTGALVTRGFLLREPSQIDRRRLYLSVTPAGHELMSRLIAESTASYAAIIERFGRDRMDHLFELLASLAELDIRTRP
jgi:homoprotocatechuate degradation regulator HpaR